MALVVIAVSTAVALALLVVVGLAARGQQSRRARLPRLAGEAVARLADLATRAAETGSFVPSGAATLAIAATAALVVLLVADSRQPIFALLIYMAGLSGAAILAFSAALMLVAAGRAGRKARQQDSR